MCGIAGIFGNPLRPAVDAMVAAMAHRGPDDSGVHSDNRCALGHARLAIIDPTPSGHQPMGILDDTVIAVFSGEIYNYKEERRLLEAAGHRFHTDSDTEVLLNSYVRYGDDFVRRLNGIFALAIYDRRRGPGRERLVLARDQFGVKPLLIAGRGDRLIFASELKALLACGLIDADIDPLALRLLLTHGSVNQPRTILKNVEALPPAHRMVVENGTSRTERYWSLGIDRIDGLRGAPYDEIVQRVGATLTGSVKSQIVSDVPVGAFLSGGIDSSVLVALMARHTSGRVKTFSVGFRGAGSDIDESGDAADVADFLGTDHTRVEVTGEDVRRHIERIAWALDQPSIDGVNSYFVSRAAAGSLKVAISGTGADEVFAGYPWFADMVRFEQDGVRGWLSHAARSGLAGFSRRIIPGRGGVGRRRSRYRCQSPFVSRYAALYDVFGPQGAEEMMAPALRGATCGVRPGAEIEANDELPAGLPIERVSGLCLRGYTLNQLLRDIDAVAMSHSVEVRVPFLDPAVADVALSLPSDAKLGALLPGDEGANSYGGSGLKRVLVDFGRGLLPPGFDGRAKRGFAMPFDAWLRGPLAEVLDDTLSPESLRRRGLFDEDAASALRGAFREGRTDWAKPWLLMMTELWCRQVPTGTPVPGE